MQKLGFDLRLLATRKFSEPHQGRVSRKVLQKNCGPGDNIGIIPFIHEFPEGFYFALHPHHLSVFFLLTLHQRAQLQYSGILRMGCNEAIQECQRLRKSLRRQVGSGVRQLLLFLLLCPILACRFEQLRDFRFVRELFLQAV